MITHVQERGATIRTASSHQFMYTIFFFLPIVNFFYLFFAKFEQMECVASCGVFFVGSQQIHFPL